MPQKTIVKTHRQNRTAMESGPKPRHNASIEQPLLSAEPPPPRADVTAVANAQVDAPTGASVLRDRLFSAYLFSAIDPKVAQALPFESFGTYREDLLRDLGGDPDPLSAMLVEQLATAHFITMGLQARVARATSPAEVGILSDAAGRLMAEFRRTTVVYREYQNTVSRTTVAPRAPDPGVPTSPAERLVNPAILPGGKTGSSKLGSNGGFDGRTAAVVPFKKPANRRRTKESA